MNRAIVIMVIALGSSTVAAQPVEAPMQAPEAPEMANPQAVQGPEVDVQRCAAQLFRVLRGAARGRLVGNAHDRFNRRVLLAGRACPFSDNLRALIRKRGVSEADMQVFDGQWRSECREGYPPGREDFWVCLPMHQMVRNLRTTLTIPFTYGHSRRLLVMALDALTEHPDLVPIAQLVWTFANWNFGCVPTPILIDMRNDLRERDGPTEVYEIGPSWKRRVGRDY